MAKSKQSRRRAMVKARAALQNCGPLAMDIRTVGMWQTALDEGSIDKLEAALMFDRFNVGSTTKIVNGVAVIPVVGALRDEVDYMTKYFGASAYSIIERDIAAAHDNREVKATVLYCNTPGGQAIGVKRAADFIHSIRGDKPIVAYVQGLCASAGYYLGAACDRIVSTPDSLVGSIGTIFPHQEFSGMLKSLGIGATVLTNKDSPKKSHGSIFEPLSSEAKQTLQDFVDSYGRAFIEDVARYRGITAKHVIENYGQGDAFVATEASRRGMVDSTVRNFDELMDSLAGDSDAFPVQVTETESKVFTPTASSKNTRQVSTRRFPVTKIIAQLFAMDLIDSIDVSAESVKPILTAFFAARGESVPKDESDTLNALQAKRESPAGASTVTQPPSTTQQAANAVQQAHDREQEEARQAAASQARATLEDLEASAAILNGDAEVPMISATMVMESFKAGQTPREAVAAWRDAIAKTEPPVPTNRVNVTGEGADRFAEDAVDAMLYRATAEPGNRRRRSQAGSVSNGAERPTISDAAMQLTNMPLWALAGRCLEMGGQQVDMYGNREIIAEQAMQMGNAQSRSAFYSAHEERQFIGASAAPHARPGDFPNILSSLSRKFLDMIDLDEWTYPEFSAVWPTGFGDFKPSTMVNHGTPEELDEVLDSGEFNELKKQEEVLSYIFCRRFGNKWGWTPTLVANDDLGAFAEGMLGLDEAWETTQHRLCLALLTSNPTLLNGEQLFSNHAQGNNDRTAGDAPSDTEWAAMETLYADVKGVGSTTRRVRGTLNTLLTPTGTQHQAARRTFMPLNAGGLEGKEASTTANVGLYRGMVNIVPEPELRDDSVSTRYYALNNPTRLRTATIVRGYFNGYGQAGRRERWYDPSNKTTWISIEGRIGVAIKNWRYAIRNKGAA